MEDLSKDCFLVLPMEECSDSFSRIIIFNQPQFMEESRAIYFAQPEFVEKWSEQTMETT